ncbi:MAG TPA: ABC transporter ATP-binding protein [Beutenbergiaceae bacterium]|nr:ABC transporter ATP-binding protein [Beutenbergiaceae bacterium]
MSDLAVRSDGLSKRFGRQLAVDNIDLAVPRGSVYGFLGPNGSGKTTTIRIILGLAAATTGRVHVLGQDMPGSLRHVLPRVGALIEGPAAYPFMSGRANLLRMDAANPKAPASTRNQRVDAALDRVGLAHAGTKRVRAYSLGMKQRLGIAGALLMPRDLLVLDEPTNGLDPQGTREVRNLIRSLAGEGSTVVLASHLLSEIEQLCTHVGVMHRGRMVAQGSLADLRGLGRSRVRVLTPDGQMARTELLRFGLEVMADDGAAGGRNGVTVVGAELPDADPPPVEDLAAALVQAGVRLRGFEVQQETLEDRFVALTGEGFDVDQ